MNPRINIIILPILLTLTNISLAQNRANPNEKAFIKYGDTCAHLTREIIGQNSERAVSLRRGIVQTCPQAIKLYKKVLKQTVQHPSTHEIFLRMDGIEKPDLTEKQKKHFCSTLSQENYNWLCK
ncbi:MAG: hypothetical protein RL344_386 [Pseudomonadota bacterium]